MNPMKKKGSVRFVVAVAAMFVATGAVHWISVLGIGLSEDFEQGVSIREGSRGGRGYMGRGLHGGK
jgi:hypothetical protein